MKILGELCCRILIRSKIQPQDIFQGAVAKKALFTHTYAIFNRNGRGRNVNVNRNGNRWNRQYRFAGVRKSLISLPFVRESFVFRVAHASLQVVCPLQIEALIGKCIF